MNKICAEIHGDVEKFKKIVNESNGTGEICRKYNFCDNGKSRNQIKEFINNFNLDISHFGFKNHPRKYESVEKECPVCKNKFITQLNHRDEKTTCSIKCCNKFFKDLRYNEQSNKKRSESIKKYCVSVGKSLHIESEPRRLKKQTICKGCGVMFHPRNSKSKYCNPQCKYNCPDYINSLKNKALERVANGTHNGWNSRNIVSYPEKFFMNVLNNNNISYEHNKKVGKYFIDFAIAEKMVALEIDGKQHLIEDRQKSDSLKDAFLKNNGWFVYRIPWKSINNDLGKKYISDEINKFLIFMGSLSIKVNPLK